MKFEIPVYLTNLSELLLFIELANFQERDKGQFPAQLYYFAIM